MFHRVALAHHKYEFRPRCVRQLARRTASDPRENAWHKKVCDGTLTLRQAQKLELAYKRAHG